MNPYAMDIHNSSNSLKVLCSRLSDPEYVRLLKATVDKNTKEIMESNRYVKIVIINDLFHKAVILTILFVRFSDFQTNLDDSV
jgi:hypothetical protein